MQCKGIAKAKFDGARQEFHDRQHLTISGFVLDGKLQRHPLLTVIERLKGLLGKAHKYF